MTQRRNLVDEPPYPLMRVLGYRITEWSAGRTVVEMTLDPEVHGNRGGFPHGGVYATLLDTACAVAAAWRPEPEPHAHVMTLSLNINYVAMPKGGRLITTASVTGGGRSTLFTKAELRDDLGNLVSTATAVVRARTPAPGATGSQAEAEA